MWGSSEGNVPFGSDPFPGLACYGSGLGQLAFDLAHLVTPQAVDGGDVPGASAYRGLGAVTDRISTSLELDDARSRST